jgi:hypothetical protein
LEIQLAGPAKLHHLVVTSPTTGWAAKSYVSTSAIDGSQGIGAWGQPTDSLTGINGSTSFNLAGRQGQWVLLWITNLGPTFQAKVAEISVN